MVTPLAISSVPTKRKGKKQGKRIVNQGNGFVSVADESGPDSPLVKTWAGLPRMRRCWYADVLDAIRPSVGDQNVTLKTKAVIHKGFCSTEQRT